MLRVVSRRRRGGDELCAAKLGPLFSFQSDAAARVRWGALGFRHRFAWFRILARLTAAARSISKRRARALRRWSPKLCRDGR